MKRFFENPEVELLKFAVADVITTSECDDDCDDDEAPMLPSVALACAGV